MAEREKAFEGLFHSKKYHIPFVLKVYLTEDDNGDVSVEADYEINEEMYDDVNMVTVELEYAYNREKYKKLDEVDVRDDIQNKIKEIRSIVELVESPNESISDNNESDDEATVGGDSPSPE